MRRASRIAAIGALLLGAGVSQAATIVTSVRTAGTGVPDTRTPTVAGTNVNGTTWTGNQGYDIIRFYAKFTPGGVEDTTSNGLGAIAGTMTASAPFKMSFLNIINPNIDSTRPYAQFDPIGTQIVRRVLGFEYDVHTDTENVNTMINIQDWDAFPGGTGAGPSETNMFVAARSVGPAKDAILAPANLGGATGTTASRISDSTSDVDPRYLYQNPSLYTWAANGQPALGVTEFRIEGAVTDGTPDHSAKSNDPNYSRGALVAIAVVPTGATVRFRGLTAEAQGIGDDQGHNTQFDVTDAIPEPGSISLLTLGAIGLLARRSRKQA